MLIVALLLLGCGGKPLNTEQTNQVRQAARYFLSGIQTGNAGWACNNSTPDYWMQAGWTKNRQASFANCLGGFKARFHSSPLDATDHAQYSRMLAQLPKAHLEGKGEAAKIQFTDMPKGSCQSSKMSLHQDGMPWKVADFIQGRCFGLAK